MHASFRSKQASLASRRVLQPTVALAAAIALWASVAWADDRLSIAPAPDVTILQELFVWSKYKVRVGPGVVYGPSYEGSSRYKLRVLPALDVKFKNVLWLHDKSLRVTLRPLGGVRLGPMITYSSGRYPSDDSNLLGLKTVSDGLEMGGYATSVIGPFAVNFDLQKEMAGGHGGWIAHLEAGTLFYQGERLSLTAGMRMTIVDQRYMDAFFGISPAESAASGLASFHAKGGVKDIGVGLISDYTISDNWSAGGVVGCSRLLGDAAASPLVRQRGSANQCIAYIRLAYQL